MISTRYQFEFIWAIRKFFVEQGLLDVLTPPMVPNPGMEVHIRPFKVAKAQGDIPTENYLHTSPEFAMKKLLSLGLKDIFTISYCFRDEPSSSIHRNQFIMLEWYRSCDSYQTIINDIELLIHSLIDQMEKIKVPTKFKSEDIKIEILTVDEIFQQYLHFSILDYLDHKNLLQLIKTKFPEIPLPKNQAELQWDDLFFLLFLNKIEEQLINHPFLILKEYPAPLCALSTIKAEDPRVCERFEFFINGIELGNCYNELTNLSEQKKRFQEQSELKNKLYSIKLPPPQILYSALQNELPPCAGIAIGVERLCMSLIHGEKYFFDQIIN